jgi:single-stranded DNA-binding protein
MIAALIAGTLFRAPEQRTSKTGKPFTTATVKIRDGGGSQFIRIFSFSESCQAELMRLDDSDALSVQGALKAETYTASDGSIKISLSIVADHVLALRQPPRERKPKAAPPPDTRPKHERHPWRDERDGPLDEIPF